MMISDDLSLLIRITPPKTSTWTHRGIVCHPVLVLKESPFSHVCMQWNVMYGIHPAMRVIDLEPVDHISMSLSTNWQ